jgi:DNA-binding transcriptional LysR family regulator
MPGSGSLYPCLPARSAQLPQRRDSMEKTQCALQLMKKAGFQPSMLKPQIRYQASDSATILAMVREGLGITLMPRMILPKKLEGVIALPLDPPQALQIGLAVRSQDMASPGATLFVETALAWTRAQATPLV